MALLWLLLLGLSTNAIAQAPTGTTVAGGSKGNGLNRLDTVQAVFVDRAGYIYVADQVNDRIMKFPPNSSKDTFGTIVAGGNGYGVALNQLKYPTGVFVDVDGAIYVADRDNHRIMKFPLGSSSGTPGIVVAGDGDGTFDDDKQYVKLHYPTAVFVDEDKTVYVADAGNHRIMKWPQGAVSGFIVAGGNGYGSAANQLNSPSGVFVDKAGAIYVADYYNHRIQKWTYSKQGQPSAGTVAGITGNPGPGANQLNSPTGVFVDELGAIYVADAENYRIQKFSPSTLPLTPVEVPLTPVAAPLKPVVAHVGITVAGVTSQPGNEDSKLHGPRGVFVDGSKTVYVADQVNNRIMKFPAGSSSGTSGTIVAGGKDYGAEYNQLAYPTGVAVDGLEAVYVADSANHRIIKFPPGSISGTFGTTVAGGNGQGAGVRQLDSPGGVLVDGDGAIYVADTYNHRIQKYTPTTSNGILVETVAGNGKAGSGATELDHPGGIFLDESGALYVADTRNNRIQKFPPGSSGITSGTTVAGVGDGTFGNGANQLHYPSSVFVDGDRAIYVADTRNNRIQKWASGPTSGTTVAGGSKGNGANQLNYPTGVAVDGDGAIYVADYGNDRIQKFSPVHTGSGGLLGGAEPGLPVPPALQLVAPLYDCPSGAFSFLTQGGDGSPIEYMAAGITAWTTNPNQFVDFELRTAADAQPLTLMVRQNGQIVRYVWDIRATCPVGIPSQVRLVAPLYDCKSGAFTFQTQGGDGSPIEYMAAGITAWTTNPNQFVDFELRTAADAQPLTLMVRQNGQIVRYVWDIRATCPVSTASARLAADGAEKGAAWRAVLYPNPVGQEVSVAIEGARHQTVRLQLTDLRGQVLIDKQVAVEQDMHQEQLGLGGAPVGLYLLRVNTAGQTRTLKVLKEQ